ncbi:hypothetical protein [Bdellovibrio sp. HCB288]|uniref:hypothetical protein n=1 Tax=Bdellovibrio sp. HCB288 TaxID=3394355 RepID=UPI0039B44D93
MKTSVLSKLTLGLVMALAMGLSACAKKGDSAVRVAKRGGEITTSSTCSTGASSIGRIYYPSNQSAFEAAVKSFVSTNLPGSAFGSIDASGSAANGVFLTMNLRFDSAGQIDKANSKVLVQIRDSLVGTIDSATQKEIPAYEVQFTSAYNGVLNKSTRKFTVTFEDQYGWIGFDGYYDNNNAYGTVYFKNYSSVDGSSLQQQTMGSFWVPTCGLLN